MHYLIIVQNACYVVAIIKYSTIRDTLYFLFDLHCRNSRGITDSPFGFSVLLQFTDLIQTEGYIEEACNVANLAYPLYFLIQFISFNAGYSDLSTIQLRQVNLFRSIKRKERLRKSSADVIKKRIREEQARREKAKERMRITRLKNVNSLQGGDESSKKSDRVGVSKEYIRSGPCFICIVCNRCLYRMSVVVFSENKHKEFINNKFHFIPLPDNSFIYARHVQKNRIKIKFHVKLFVISYTLMISQ